MCTVTVARYTRAHVILRRAGTRILLKYKNNGGESQILYCCYQLVVPPCYIITWSARTADGEREIGEILASGGRGGAITLYLYITLLLPSAPVVVTTFCAPRDKPARSRTTIYRVPGIRRGNSRPRAVADCTGIFGNDPSRIGGKKENDRTSVAAPAGQQCREYYGEFDDGFDFPIKRVEVLTR